MKAYSRMIPVLFLLFSFGCCISPATWTCCGPTPTAASAELMRNPQWNHKTILKLRMGMPLAEFEAVFGPPDRGSGNTMESKVVSTGKTMIYEYDMGKHADSLYPDIFKVNKVYFNMETDPPVVERWDLEYVY